MKTVLLSALLILLTVTLQVRAQDVNQQLKTASDSYAAGDLENARFALQEALRGVNQAIGQEILDMLPPTLDGMDKVASSDNVSGTNYGFAGLYINREYGSDSLGVTIQVVSDSPLLAGLNTMLSMSVFMASDPNQKRIKVAGYKALMTRSEDSDGQVSYEIQMPFSSSLLTFQSKGIPEEQKVTDMLNALPVAQIVAVAQ
jgi:hypothetical protein